MAVNKSSASGGKLVDNLVHFARVLRAAGLPIGPGKVLTAVTAISTTGIRRRDDFYWTLHAVFVNRREQRELFDQAFHLFWRNPRLLERLLALQLPGPDQRIDTASQPLARRIAEAMAEKTSPSALEQETKLELDAALTWSQQELLQEKDFEQMSLEELVQAKQLLQRFSLPIADALTRRYQIDRQGPRIDMRASLRLALRHGGDLLLLQRKTRRCRPPPLVLLCDISGSMSRYSRMLLHFAHALSNSRKQVFTFVFGTRLSNITRQLRHKDVDQALDKVAQSVQDWSGGTCIGPCLQAFNKDWSRRVLGQGALVLFISDGLDRDNHIDLSQQIERLSKSCRQLIWLNPLLRYQHFQPKAQGIRAILPHVHQFRAAHNLNSLLDLAKALQSSDISASRGTHSWQQTRH